MTEELTYEQIVEQLEAVTAELAGGTAGIEAAADLFEQAQAAARRSVSRLEQVRKRLEALTPD